MGFQGSHRTSTHPVPDLGYQGILDFCVQSQGMFVVACSGPQNVIFISMRPSWSYAYA